MWALVLASMAGLTATRANDGQMLLQLTSTNASIRVRGDKDDDWWLESSTNLTTWTTLTNSGPLLSGNVTNAPRRNLGSPYAWPTYYRARQTEGLYDPSLFRTVSLVYTQVSAALFRCCQTSTSM